MDVCNLANAVRILWTRCRCWNRLGAHPAYNDPRLRASCDSAACIFFLFGAMAVRRCIIISFLHWLSCVSTWCCGVVCIWLSSRGKRYRGAGCWCQRYMVLLEEQHPSVDAREPLHVLRGQTESGRKICFRPHRFEVGVEFPRRVFDGVGQVVREARTVCGK